MMEDLTPEQEDFILEQAIEGYYEEMERIDEAGEARVLQSIKEGEVKIEE